MLDFFRENSYIIVALSGAVAATLLSFFINYFRREKKILGYKTISRKIVERNNRDLEIKYRGQAIECLYSHQVNLSNVGNRALKDLPVRISCDGGKIVEYEFAFPEGAKYQVSLEETGQTLIVKCDLLNRTEQFKVGLTVMDSTSNKITVIARAEDLKCKEMVDYYLDSIAGNVLISNVLYDMVRFIITRR